ncbi:1,3-beta-glucanosyltransferase gas1 [Haplosporangium gracile]|nr:1,3-beta-glucanosyltransferase gas1 [Haplosporangium gracile]
MTNTWFGGIVYEWSQEDNNYGLIQINADNLVSLLPDFQALKAVMSSVRPTGVNIDAYNEQRPHSACAAITTTWEPSGNLSLTPSSEACDCMMSSLGCVTSEQALSASDSLGTELNTVYYSSVGQAQPSSCHFNGIAMLSTAAKPSDEGYAVLQGVQTSSLITKRAVPHTFNAVSRQERSTLDLTAMTALAALI